ncbi:MAG: hypothetical protein NWE89_15250 [Candidatus Bathyarchaeota archaeon]|nr:hypothetical protein [Candidatus Bathyarchaeota archaeon]
MNFKSLKSYRIAKYLLNNRISSQTKISNETEIAIGYVNEVLHDLADLDIVKIGYGKTTLIDYAKFLDKISMDRSFKKNIKKTFRLPTLSIVETENMLKRYCNINKIDYAFSGFSALRHFYVYHISYPLVHIYIQNTDDLIGLEQGEGAIPVVVLKPDRPDIFLNSFLINDVSICEKMQVIIDLYSSGLGRDAAIKYYRDMKWSNEIY